MKRTFQLLTLAFVFLIFNTLEAQEIDWKEFPLELNPAQQEHIVFGHLDLPEYPAANGPFKMAFAVIRENLEAPKKNALIIIPGGPGGDIAQYAPGVMRSAFFELTDQYDIVLADPRGTGYSEPKACDNLDTPLFQYPGIWKKERKTVEAARREALEACKNSLAEQGIDLNGYSSKQLARDIEVLRRTLGYDQWVIYGHSYGSYHGQALLQQFPETIKTAVLSGIVAPGKRSLEYDFEGFASSLKALLDECATDSNCNESYPDLEDQIFEVLNRLRDAPMEIDVLDGDETLLLNDYVFLGAIFQLMYGKSTLEIIPLLIQTVNNEEAWLMQNLAEGQLQMFAGLRNDVSVFVNCNDSPDNYAIRNSDAYNDPFASRLHDHWFNTYFPDRIDCDQLGIPEPEIPGIERSTVVVDSLTMQTDTIPIHWAAEVPILILDGEMDPVTAPMKSEVLLQFMPHAKRYTVANRGHDVRPGAMDFIVDFIENPSGLTEASPGPEPQAMNFVSGVTLNPGVSSLAVAAASGIPTIAYVAGIGTVFLVLALLLALFVGVKSLLTRSEAGIRRRIWLLLGVSVLTAGGLYLAFISALSINPMLPLFGLPAHWSWALYLPWILLFVLLWNIVRSVGTQESSKAAWWVKTLSFLGAMILLAVLFSQGIH
ncbi:alpha/beta hydrolase fold [Robiginitalea myxolifaciens]|uniref:Proline iminopeptidase n=1 Tax=Robiginitalea myxolifaciens TaxID=400055 RepID=A0A1I6H6B7_9FLAO|nr:alpha/beta fold hydrolase [Robiginitalea myxolifaciens]SFR49841.1 alpha/beta hydrolase fold [Robiginitalea myxolifaciens]